LPIVPCLFCPAGPVRTYRAAPRDPITIGGARPENLARTPDLRECERAVIVAVLAVWAVQVAADEIVPVVAVRYRLVPAAAAMRMVLGVLATSVLRRARRRIRPRRLEHTLVGMPVVWVMQVAIVQIIRMALVIDGRVTAARSVLVVMPVMRRVTHRAPPCWPDAPSRRKGQAGWSFTGREMIHDRDRRYICVVSADS
jgi:hypothetical protein